MILATNRRLPRPALVVSRNRTQADTLTLVKDQTGIPIRQKSFTAAVNSGDLDFSGFSLVTDVADQTASITLAAMCSQRMKVT